MSCSANLQTEDCKTTHLLKFLSAAQQELVVINNYIKRRKVNRVQLDLSHGLAFSMETHRQNPIFTNAELLFYQKNQVAIKLSM